MSNRDSSAANEWFTLADMDIEAAEILLTEDGPLFVIGFHIQQALEKYLKGYLLSTGWSLRRIHDLEILVQEAIALDNDFAPFLAACQEITEYYIETRYPMAFHTPLQRETLEDNLATTQNFIALVRRKVTPSS